MQPPHNTVSSLAVCEGFGPRYMDVQANAIAYTARNTLNLQYIISSSQDKWQNRSTGAFPRKSTSLIHVVCTSTAMTTIQLRWGPGFGTESVYFSCMKPSRSFSCDRPENLIGVNASDFFKVFVLLIFADWNDMTSCSTAILMSTTVIPLFRAE